MIVWMLTTLDWYVRIIKVYRCHSDVHDDGAYDGTVDGITGGAIYSSIWNCNDEIKVCIAFYNEYMNKVGMF